MKSILKNRAVIITLSVVLPLAVAILFRVRVEGYDFSFLPPIYAAINGITAVLLVSAVWCIRNGNRVWHERLMITSVILSAAFLVMYVLYHITSDPTPYGGSGWLRYVYYFILITHIALSVAITPMVLFTLSRAWNGTFDLHKKLARITYPIWLYIAVTGVVVYVMISPYYS